GLDLDAPSGGDRFSRLLAAFERRGVERDELHALEAFGELLHLIASFGAQVDTGRPAVETSGLVLGHAVADEADELHAATLLRRRRFEQERTERVKIDRTRAHLHPDPLGLVRTREDPSGVVETREQLAFRVREHRFDVERPALET